MITLAKATWVIYLGVTIAALAALVGVAGWHAAVWALLIQSLVVFIQNAIREDKEEERRFKRLTHR